MTKEFSYNGHIEKAELITEWNQIKEFDILWDDKCSKCGRQERFTIFNFANYKYTNSDSNEIKIGKGWQIIPEFCNYELIIPESTTLITNKRLYKVINPIEDINKEIEEEMLDKKLFV